VFSLSSDICIKRPAVYGYRPFSMKIFALLIAAAIAPPLLAQASPPAAAPDVPHTKTLLDAMIAAGPIMLALLALSVFFVMLVVVYLMTIRRGAVVSLSLIHIDAADE
jgi:hypothetical protein